MTEQEFIRQSALFETVCNLSAHCVVWLSCFFDFQADLQSQSTIPPCRLPVFCHFRRTKKFLVTFYEPLFQMDTKRD